jgi:hypothetical protein
MNETVKYTWTEDLGKASLNAYFRHKTGRVSFILGGGIASCLLGVSFCIFSANKGLGGLAIFIGMTFGILAFKLRNQVRRLAKDAQKLVDDPCVTLAISDDALTITSGRSSRTVEWTRMTHSVDVDGFLLVFTGELPVASLPHNVLSEAQASFIRSKVRSSQR